MCVCVCVCVCVCARVSFGVVSLHLGWDRLLAAADDAIGTPRFKDGRQFECHSVFSTLCVRVCVCQRGHEGDIEGEKGEGQWKEFVCTLGYPVSMLANIR
jgi:hypothetical protein